MNATTFQAAIRRGAAYLNAVAEPNGSFMGYVNAGRHDFAAAKPLPATFFTALIVSILGPLPLAGWKQTEAKALEFLKGELSPLGSVNYWIRGSAEYQQRPHPDDLDDTCVTLAALTLVRPELVDGAALGKLARLLVAAETSPGGPYRTWLVGPDAAETWQDTDLAVNANIGYLLSLHDTQLPALNAMLEQALASGRLTSRYYPEALAIVYFWSRFYEGQSRQDLRDWLSHRLAGRAIAASSLKSALAVTTGLQLGLPRADLRSLVAQLVERQSPDGSWAAEAFYFESQVGKVSYYAGAKALTTAFAIEALERWQTGQIPTLATEASPNAWQQAVKTAALRQTRQLPAGQLRERLSATIKRTFDYDTDGQITSMPLLTSEAISREPAAETMQQLALGSLYGWVAYTIYDDFLDDEGRPALLSVANVALRESVVSFTRALPAQPDFTQLVHATLNQVDAANAWEVANARATNQAGTLNMRQLPDYGERAQLAERSLGHELAAVGVLMAMGHDRVSPAVTALEQFFHHFLIARQLNDDAHDWEDDLARGHLSAAVASLLASYFGKRRDLSVPLAPEGIAQLRRHFWRETAVGLADLIIRHADAARQALQANSAITDPAPFERLLAPLAASARQVISERQRVLDFMQEYRGHDSKDAAL